MVPAVVEQCTGCFTVLTLTSPAWLCCGFVHLPSIHLATPAEFISNKCLHRHCHGDTAKEAVMLNV